MLLVSAHTIRCLRNTLSDLQTVCLFQFHKSFSFQAYLEADIVSILQGRVGGLSIVDPKAVTFIAKKTSNVKGDARQAIEMLTTALRNAKEKAQDQAEKGVPAAEGYLVTMKDVIRLNTDFIKLTALMESLPTYAKLVVVAAVNVALKTSGSTNVLTRQDLIKAGVKVIQEKFPYDYVDESDINDQINLLHDNGVANIETTFGTEPTDPIVFNHLPQELDVAVTEALRKEDFFDV